MNISDFNQPLSSTKLRENISKQFGVNVNFKKYNREQLEDIRNKIRTDVFQMENAAGINDLINNESYQKNKAMLELLNTRIKEMLGEDIKKLKDKLQHLDEAKKGVRAPKHTKKSKGTKKPDLTGDGKNDFDDVQVARMTAGGVPKKKAVARAKADNLKEESKSCNHTAEGKMCEVHGKKACPVEETRTPAVKTPGKWKDKSGREHPSTFVKGGKYTGKEADQKPKKKDESIVRFRQHVKMVNEGLVRLLNEDEEEKAKAITAASDIVNDYTSWMQRVGQYQTKAMIELADEIRHEFGAEKAEQFKQSVAPALSATLDTLMQQREAISSAVATLAGEAAPVMPMGPEPEMSGPPEEPMEPTAPDMMNEPAGDEFAASDAAAGAGAQGRDLREGALRKLAESHSIISKLAK